MDVYEIHLLQRVSSGRISQIVAAVFPRFFSSHGILAVNARPRGVP